MNSKIIVEKKQMHPNLISARRKTIDVFRLSDILFRLSDILFSKVSISSIRSHFDLDSDGSELYRVIKFAKLQPCRDVAMAEPVQNLASVHIIVTHIIVTRALLVS